MLKKKKIRESRFRIVPRQNCFSGFSFSLTFPHTCAEDKTRRRASGYIYVRGGIYRVIEEEYTYAFSQNTLSRAQAGKQGYKTTRMEAKSIPFNCRTRPWSISKRVLRLSPRLHRADKEKN